jgi:hypothetical protein
MAEIWKPKSRGINYTSSLEFGCPFLRRELVGAAVVVVVVVAHSNRSTLQETRSSIDVKQIIVQARGRGGRGSWLGRVCPRVETGIPRLGYLR